MLLTADDDPVEFAIAVSPIRGRDDTDAAPVSDRSKSDREWISSVFPVTGTCYGALSQSVAGRCAKSVEQCRRRGI